MRGQAAFIMRTVNRGQIDDEVFDVPRAREIPPRRVRSEAQSSGTVAVVSDDQRRSRFDEVAAGQLRSSAARVTSLSPGWGLGSVLSCVASVGSTVINTAGISPFGTTRWASSRSVVRCPTHSVCVPLQ